MPPAQSPEKPEDASYAVVVDPSGWSSSTDSLVVSIREGFNRLDSRLRLAAAGELHARLEAGPTTVIENVSKAMARALVESLAQHGVRARLRRGASPPRKPPPPPPAPEHSPPRPAGRKRRRRPPATMMEGWQRSLAPKDTHNETASAASDSVEQVGPAPDARDRATVLGWGDVIRTEVADSAEASKPEGPTSPAASSPTADPSDGMPRPSEPGPPSSVGGLEPSQTPSDAAPPSPVSGATGPAPSEAKQKQPIPSGHLRVVDEGLSPPALASAAHARLLPGRPVPLDALMPRPWLAMLFGLLAPGAGQVYLGQDEAARRFAFSAPMVIPWVRSVRQAKADARLVRDGRQAARTQPRPWRAAGFALSVWAVVAVLALGSIWAYRSLTTPTVAPSETSEATPATPPAPLDETTSPTEPGTGEAAAERADLATEVETRRRRVRARRLLSTANEACEAQEFDRCAELSDQARQLDPDLRAAVRLFHTATLALEQQTEPHTAPTDDPSAPTCDAINGDEDACP